MRRTVHNLPSGVSTSRQYRYFAIFSLFDIQDESEIYKHLDDRRTKLADFGVALQPSIIVAVTSGDSLVTVQVIINDRRYSSMTGLRALEMLFKIHMAADIQHDCESKNVVFSEKSV